MTLEEFMIIMKLDVSLGFGGEGYTFCIERSDIKDIKGVSLLIGEHGIGGTPSEARDDYVEQLKGRCLVIDAMGGDKRREYNVPDNLV